MSRQTRYPKAAESFMATIKTQLVKRTTFKTRDAARLALFEYIETFCWYQRWGHPTAAHCSDTRRWGTTARQSSSRSTQQR
jgi:hypothetical protein